MTNRRNRRRQTVAFDQRLRQAADAAREAARRLPDGLERDTLLKKASQAEAAVHINEWLMSPAQRPLSQGQSSPVPSSHISSS
jgi:hypothetical protein